ncbi:MAG: MipA/OmpV family protein [Bdellovibrionales bacterium]|nr:MipA/OmpV family protein [Bdellovibrionales bacterium]
MIKTFFSLILITAFPLQAQEHLRMAPKPLYEFGLGGGYFRTPYYQGSEQYQTRSLGLPFFIYRGKIIKSDKDGGTRAEFFKQKGFRFDMSFSGGFSAKSSEIDARQGMPDLDWMGAVGPRIRWNFYRSRKWGAIFFNLPVRSVFVTDFKTTRDEGFLFHPNFTYKVDKVLFDNLDMIFRLGTIFSDRRYSEYYYEVSPKYATSSRPEYQAKSGLLEEHFDIASAIRISPSWRLFAGVQYSQYNGVANKESPLLTAKNTLSWGVGIIWRMYESEQRAGKWY